MLAEGIALYTWAFLLCCAYTDFRYRKVYNRVTFPSMAIGLAANLFTHAYRYAPAVAALFALYFFSYFKKRGMGDIKLVMAVVCLCGINKAFVMVIGGYLILFLQCLIFETKTLVLTGIDFARLFLLKTPMPKRSDVLYPMAPYFAAGYLFCYFV